MKISKGLLLGTLLQFSSGQNITVSIRTNLGLMSMNVCSDVGTDMNN